MLAGSRGYGPLRSVLVGGVSGRLMRTVQCPVIVVPRGAEAPLSHAVRRGGRDRGLTSVIVATATLKGSRIGLEGHRKARSGRPGSTF